MARFPTKDQIETCMKGFRELKEIGRGGYGVVFAAYDVFEGRRVALKVMSPGPDQTPDDLLERGRAEFATLKSAALLDCVVPVYRAGACRCPELPDVPLFWYTMELCETSVAGLLPTLSHRHRRQVVMQLIDGLWTLHREGVPHRDLKPHNLFVRGSDLRRIEIRLGDLGIARRARAEATAASLPLTPEYVAPEFLDAPDTAPDSFLADQYSAAVVAWQVLTAGALPFDGSLADVAAILYARLRPPPPLVVRDFRGSVDPLDRVLRRMLTREPAGRYPTLRDCHKSLISAFEGCAWPG